MAENTYEARLKRVEDAIALKEPDRVPICPNFGILAYGMEGCSNKDAMYNYPRAFRAQMDFYRKHPMMDAACYAPFTCGKANEIAGTTIIDWPGRPGTKVPDQSTYQVIEYEYMFEEEYPEILKDFTGFMLRKWVPRAFTSLKGLSGIRFEPTAMLGTLPLKNLGTPEAIRAFETLAEIAKAEAECNEWNGKLAQGFTDLGYPEFFNNLGEVPFDVIGDYYRGTLATLTDQLDHEEELEELCYRIADLEIEAFSYYKDDPRHIKRISFPFHKGMDGFMSADQYERIYWKPFRKIVDALIEMGVTPYLYTEGKYNTRLEQLRDLPKGKCMIHFERVNMKEAKRILGENSCIVGNFPMILLDTGTPHQVEEEVKRLLDICMPGGGYIFDCDGSIDLAKPENLDAMFNALLKYGTY